MARAHSRLAARSRPISASLMVSGTDTCKTPSPARHSIFPSRDAQGSAPGPGEDFGAGNCVCSKKIQIPRGPQGPLAPLTAERGAARQRKAAGAERRHFRGGAGSGGGGEDAMVCDKCEYGVYGGAGGSARPAGPCPHRACPRGFRATLSGAVAAGPGLLRLGRGGRFPAGPWVSCLSPLCEQSLVHLWSVLMRVV